MNRLLLVSTVLAAAATLAIGPSTAPAAPRATSSAASCPKLRLPQHRPTTIYSEAQVDRPAKPRRRNPEVPWPGGADPRLGAEYESRTRQMTQGEVELRFVVDSAGCADMESVEVVASSDSAFTLAVVDVLPKWRFDPAVKDGKKVAQLLHWKWVLYQRNGARIP